MGRAHHRAVVAVAQGEGIGQCVVVGKVGPGVVAHGQGPLGGAFVGRLGVDTGERVHLPAIAAQVLGLPVVGEIEGAVGQIGIDGVEVEGQEFPGRRRIGIGGAVLGEHSEVTGRMVVEPPDTGVGAVVVVERPVLHHQEDDVLDRSEVGAGRWDGGSLGHGRRGRRPASPTAPGGDEAHPRYRPGGQQLPAGDPPPRIVPFRLLSRHPSLRPRRSRPTYPTYRSVAGLRGAPRMAGWASGPGPMAVKDGRGLWRSDHDRRRTIGSPAESLEIVDGAGPAD